MTPKEIKALETAMQTATQQYHNAVEEKLKESGKEFKVEDCKQEGEYCDEDIVAIRWDNTLQQIQYCTEHEILAKVSPKTPSYWWHNAEWLNGDKLNELYSKIVWE